jgi:Sec-independent protein translocase protein TatA
MFNLDPGKLLIIAVVAVILLGPDKLPQVARQAGAMWRTFTEFRRRMESEVRGTLPDLPSSAEIARMTRSPTALLNRLSTMGEPGVKGNGKGKGKGSSRRNGSLWGMGAGTAAGAGAGAAHGNGNGLAGADGDPDLLDQGYDDDDLDMGLGTDDVAIGFNGAGADHADHPPYYRPSREPVEPHEHQAEAPSYGDPSLN